MLGEVFNYAAMGAGVAVFAAAAISSIFTVGEKEEKLITRFGKHVRTAATPGLKAKIPFIDKVAATIGTDLHTEKLEDLQFRGSDKQFFQLPVVIQYRITDTKKFNFDVNNPIEQMREFVTKAVRTYCAGKDYDQLLTEKDEADVAVKEDVKDTVAQLGITITNILVNDPDVDAKVKEAYNHVVVEQQRRLAAVTKAKADLEVREIEGQAVSKFRTESMAGYPELVKLMKDAGIEETVAMDFVRDMAVLDKYERMASDGNAILLPAPTSRGNQGGDLTEILTALKTLDVSNRAQKPQSGVANGPT
jgi:regulator of protease activity HflC (stomatin/prohibitin superfamily)